MPYPGDYASESEFMEACVSSIMDQGYSQDLAVAECAHIWRHRDKVLPYDPDAPTADSFHA